jgi:hypothetical protein
MQHVDECYLAFNIESSTRYHFSCLTFLNFTITNYGIIVVTLFIHFGR